MVHLDSSQSAAPLSNWNDGLTSHHYINNPLSCSWRQYQCTYSFGQFLASDQLKQISCCKAASFLVSGEKPGVIKVVKCDTKLMLTNTFKKTFWERSLNSFGCWWWWGVVSLVCMWWCLEWKSSGRLTHICTFLHLCLLASTAKVEMTTILWKFNIVPDEKDSQNLSHLSWPKDSFMIIRCSANLWDKSWV